MALVIMKFNLCNCMIATKLILLSCFCFVFTFNLWCWHLSEAKSDLIPYFGLLNWEKAFLLSSICSTGAQSSIHLLLREEIEPLVLTSLHFTCSIVNSNSSSSNDFPRLSVPSKDAHLTDIKSMCILCPQKVTVVFI